MMNIINYISLLRPTLVFVVYGGDGMQGADRAMGYDNALPHRL